MRKRLLESLRLREIYFEQGSQRVSKDVSFKVMSGDPVKGPVQSPPSIHHFACSPSHVLITDIQDMLVFCADKCLLY